MPNQRIVEVEQEILTRLNEAKDPARMEEGIVHRLLEEVAGLREARSARGREVDKGVVDEGRGGVEYELHDDPGVPVLLLLADLGRWPLVKVDGAEQAQVRHSRLGLVDLHAELGKGRVGQPRLLELNGADPEFVEVKRYVGPDRQAVDVVGIDAEIVGLEVVGGRGVKVSNLFYVARESRRSGSTPWILERLIGGDTMCQLGKE